MTSDSSNKSLTGPRSVRNDGADTRKHGSKSTPLEYASGDASPDSIQSSDHAEEMGSSVAPHTVPESGTTQNRARSKPPPIETCADLLRLAYGGKRRIRPKKAEIDVLRVGHAPEYSEREELLDLAKSDRTLTRTLDLMLFSIERSDVLRLAAQIQEFIGDALQQHPAFQAKRLEGVLKNRTDGPGEEEAVRFLSSQSYESLSWPAGVPSLKTREAEHCRVNASVCLLLWFRETRGTSFDRILWYLRSFVYAPLAKHLSSEVQKIRVLTGSRDRAAVAVAFAVLEMRVLKEAQIAAGALKAQKQAVERAKELQNRVMQLENDLRSARADVTKLCGRLESAKQDHDNERAYLQDDYAQLKGRVVRRLREEVTLLNEGLHALRRNPPKIHVMEDHAERAIDRLKRELDRLKRED